MSEALRDRASGPAMPGFFSAVEDVAADKAFVVYGGEETYRFKPDRSYRPEVAATSAAGAGAASDVGKRWHPRKRV